MKMNYKDGYEFKLFHIKSLIAIKLSILPSINNLVITFN